VANVAGGCLGASAEAGALTVIDLDGTLRDIAADAAIRHPGFLSYINDSASVNQFFTQVSEYRGYVLVASLRMLLAALDASAKPLFTSWVEGGGLRRLGGFVFAGEPSRLSACNYENWYRELTSAGSGIWAGSGINSQQLLKAATSVPAAIAIPPDGFAWLVVRNKQALVKHVAAKPSS
jgi:hypothetical protein